MRDFFRRIHYLLDRRRLERDLAQDMAVHREMLGEDRKSFGNPTLLAEQSREAWGWGWLERLFQDMRFGLRMFRKSPILAATAMAVLALGIGVNVTAFNIIDVVYLKPLPVRAPQSLVRFKTQFPEGTSTQVAYPAALFYAEHSSALASLIAQRDTSLTLRNQQDESRTVQAEAVTGNYFAELGTRPAYGRLFQPGQDDRAGSSPVVVLSYGFWQKNFSSNPEVVGRTIRLNQQLATVIGIAPFNFAGLEPVSGIRNDLWFLISQEPYFVPGSKTLTSFDAIESGVHMFARLKPNVTRKAAEQALLPLAEELVHQHPDDFRKGERLAASPGGYADTLEAGDLPLFGLLCALFFLILATACGNLGSLLLGHAVTREHEVSIRMSLGATRGRIVRQLMTENFFLALAGSAAGILLSWAASRAVVAWIDVPISLDFTPDWRTFGFAFAAGAAACLLFGLPPARQLARQIHKASRARTFFMATQVTASCVLLVVSALLVRALDRAVNHDPGFDYRHALTVDPSLYSHAFTPTTSAAYLQELETRLQQVPGVESTALLLCPPFGNRARIQGVRGRLTLNVYINAVSPSFFRTMGIPILQGRTFTANDHNAVIVSQSYTQKMWPGKDPLLQLYFDGRRKLPVVGVVGNARAVGMRDGNSAEMYVLMEGQDLNEAQVLVRSTRPPGTIAGVLAEVGRAVNPLISPEVRPVEDAFQEKVGASGKIAGIISGMGLLALLLAVVGLYGVVAFNVSQRTREIGIRVALGARPAQVLTNMVSGLVKPLGIALLAGVGLAAAVSIVLRTQLYGISNLDPVSYIAAAALLSVTGGIAAFLPARQALKVDPNVALRCE